MENTLNIKNTIRSEIVLKPETRILNVSKDSIITVFDFGDYLKEINVEDNAELHLYCVDKDKDNGKNNDISYVSKTININSNAKVYLKSFYSKEDKLNINLKCLMNGDKSFFQNDFMYFVNEDFKYEFKIENIFIGENNTGKNNIKGLVRNNAKVAVDGIIDIKKTGIHTNADLNEEIINLSERSKIRQLPILYVANNDVKATHSASIRKLDGEALYYLETRGISKDIAKQFLINGFLADIMGQFSCNNHLTEYFEESLKMV